MAQVSGVEQKVGLSAGRVDLVYGCLEGANYVFVCVLAKTDVAVAYLNEVEARCRHRPCGGAIASAFEQVGETVGIEDATVDGKHQARAGPGHAFEEPASVD